MIQESTYFKFQKGASNDLVVAFSAATVPKGKFSFSNILVSCEANVLYLNCPDNTWYLNDVEKKGDAISYYKNVISNCIKEQGITYTTFFGGSMGAYGALLYGCLLKADEIHCLGLEYQLFLEHSNSRKYFINKPSCLIPNLDLLLSESSFKNLYIYYGERALIDLYQASLVPNLTRIKKTPLKDLTHSIPPSLMDKFDVGRSLDNKSLFIDIKKSFPLGDSDIEQEQFIFQSLYDAHVEYKSGYQSIRTIDKLKMTIENTVSTSIKYLSMAYLGLLLERKLPEKAIGYLIEAKEKSTFLSELYPALIRLERKNSFQRSIKSSYFAMELHRPDKLDAQLDIVYEHCLNLFHSQKYKETIIPALEFKRYRPSHNHIKYILSTSYLALKDKNEAFEHAPSKQVLAEIPMYKLLFQEFYGDENE